MLGIVRGRIELFNYFTKIIHSFPRIAYYALLLRALRFVCFAPFIVLFIYVVFDKISLFDAAFAVPVISILVVFICAKPYLDDLFSLTFFVEKMLDHNHNGNMPKLKFSSNIRYLSEIINKLNLSWYQKNFKLEALIIENRILLNSLPDILLMVNIDLKIVNYNLAAENAFKTSLRNKKINDIIDNVLLLNFMNLVMQQKKPKTLELYLKELSKYFMIRIERFPSYSDEIAMIIVLIDISESKRNEQTFADFIANASHEIKTPLASLTGFIEILQTTAVGDTQAQEKFLQIMAKQAERLNCLVNDLLSLSKIEMDMKCMPENEVSLVAIVKTAISESEFNLETHNISLDLQIEDNIPLILGDENQLIQVITNLISNSIKYGYSNSILRIKIEVLVPDYELFPKFRGLNKV